MSFEKSFCPSPWFHMRITSSGAYDYCRWKSSEIQTNPAVNISQLTPLEYFHNNMSDLRNKLLQGQAVSGCKDCVNMEQHNKVSGRQRQLLKVGINPNHFTKSLPTNTYHKDFVYSAAHLGDTTRTVRDWQIDLGNYCNSQCIMCNPNSSSRIAAEFKNLGIISELPPPAWCDDPILLNRFIDDLVKCKDIEYLHFIGGETLIVPGFKKILQAVIDTGLASNISVGFTTNLTIPPADVINLLDKFKQVNLGLSIETIDSVNDYVRYPSKIDQTKKLLDQWITLSKQLNWYVQLRTTPTLLSVGRLVTIYDYAWNHELAVESCNFISSPSELRISVLPHNIRLQIAERINNWISTHNVDVSDTVFNTRNPALAKAQLVQDAQSYVNYLINVEDESNALPDTIKFIKRLEHSRGNCIIDYLPEYEDLFRSHGY